MIALHGCGGLGGHSEPVQPRYRDWAEQLLKTGHAVLLPDSYGSRELGPQCRVKRAPRAGPPRTGGRYHGVAAMAAAAALGGAGSYQPGRMGERRQRGVVGGASATASRSDRAGFPLGDGVLSGLPDLLRPRLERAGADPAADRRQDDVSSPPACRQMVDGARGRSALARIVVYPGAPHDFDRANLPLRAIAGAMPRCPSAAISAPMPKRAPIRKSASRNGWRVK